MNSSSLVTLLVAALCRPALNNALALPALSSPPRAGRRMMDALNPIKLSGIRGSCSLTILRGVRGGDDDSDSDSYEYYDVSSSDGELTDSEDDEDEPPPSSDTGPSDVDKDKDTELIQKRAALSQKSRNFGIATALWSSLFFDSILNKAKRNDLFPSIVQGVATVVPAATLASGFALSSCVAFLMWREFEITSETVGGGESKKGDSFLSLSSINEEGAESEKFAMETRQRLLFHLILFGLINLGAHAGLLFSNQAPFLGMSAAIINVHNTLACLSALIEEKSVPELIKQAISWPLSFFRSSGRAESDAKKEGTITFLFRLSAVAAWMRCIPVCKSLFALAMGAAAASDTIHIVDKAREISLTVASLARLTLTAGVAKTLCAASASSADSIRNHRFFATLSGMLSMIFFGLGGTMLYSSSLLNISLNKAVLAEGALLAVTALVAGYNSISCFNANKGTA